MVMVQITISLSEEIANELAKIAELQGMSRAALVRREVLQAMPALRIEVRNRMRRPQEPFQAYEDKGGTVLKLNSAPQRNGYDVDDVRGPDDRGEGEVPS